MASGKRYRLNEQKLAERQGKLGPQPELIVKAMMDAGTGLTVKEIADFIKDRLVTRQPPERVVNFYMSTWKKTGLVYVTQGVPEAPVSTGNSENGPEVGDIATEIPPAIFEDTPKFDYAAATLKSAVLQVLKENPAGGNAMDVHAWLQVMGKSAKVKAVADTVSKLVKDGQISKAEDGRLTLLAEVHA